jgi:hypothetical protein
MRRAELRNLSDKPLPRKPESANAPLQVYPLRQSLTTSLL